MIIVCSGDSFTHGMELWEEKNAPGYTELKTQKDAFDATNKSLDIEDERLKLTWTESLRNHFDCMVINLGQDGSCQLSMTERTITKLLSLRKQYPNEKMVCVMQDTQLERVWLWCDEFEKNLNVIVSGAETFFPGNKLEAYQLKNIYLTMHPGEMLLSEYYLQGLAVRNCCLRNNIDFLHFQMFRDWKKSWYKFDELMFEEIENLYFDPKFTIEKSMTQMLIAHYKHNDFTLPGKHVNCAAQQVIGNIIADELKNRGLV
jgi:hypothetical protein